MLLEYISKETDSIQRDISTVDNSLINKGWVSREWTIDIIDNMAVLVWGLKSRLYS